MVANGHAEPHHSVRRITVPHLRVDGQGPHSPNALLREVGWVSAKRQRPPCRVVTSPSQVSCVAGRVPRSPLRSRRVLERETQTRQLSKPIQDAAARKHARWQFSRLRRCAQMSAASATSVRQDATALLQHVQVSAAGSTAQLQDPWCSSRIRGAAACNLTADRLSANTPKSCGEHTNKQFTNMHKGRVQRSCGSWRPTSLPAARQSFRGPNRY